jgi:hypothetical protein
MSNSTEALNMKPQHFVWDSIFDKYLPFVEVILRAERKTILKVPQNLISNFSYTAITVQSSEPGEWDGFRWYRVLTMGYTASRPAVGPIPSYSLGTEGSSSVGKAVRGVKLTTHLHLPLKLTMHGATSSCPHKSS